MILPQSFVINFYSPHYSQPVPTKYSPLKLLNSAPSAGNTQQRINTAQSTFTVQVLDRAAAIDILPGELDALAANALEPNIFNEPIMFIPALQLIDRNVPLWIVCVRDRAGVLRGVVALVCEPLRRGLPAKVLRNWRHRYSYLGTPLLDRRCAREVLEAVARWVESDAAPAGGLQWANVSWDGPFGQLVRKTIGQSRYGSLDVLTTQRATLERSQATNPAISGKHAKELRRLERHLATHGRLEYSMMQGDDDWQSWFEQFLAIEASGWKGLEGSAIASKVDDTEFFRRVLRQAHATGALQFLRLSVGGKAVAMKLNLRAMGISYSLKIGHDETYARFSPGVLLELFNMKAFLQEPDCIVCMDSCASSNHPMINRLWSGRRELATVTLARHGTLLHAQMRLQLLARRVRNARLDGVKRQARA